MINYIVKKPLITEKTLALAATRNTYVFEVARTAEKNQIKQIIEELFKVNVVSVNTVLGHTHSKKTGRKRLHVAQPRIKKAMVQLKNGQKIDIFDLEGQSA
jgi:large subunit ribosomal protein L23